MQALPAYLLSVLTASFFVALEIGALGTAGNLAAGMRLSPKDVLFGLQAMTFLPFLIFVFAAFIAAVPFLLFYPAYRKQRGSTARNAAMLFGVLVAFGGLSLMLGLLGRPTGLTLWEAGQFALLALLPGMASGWVFHKAMTSLSATLRSPASRDEGSGKVF